MLYYGIVNVSMILKPISYYELLVYIWNSEVILFYVYFNSVDE